MIGSSGCDQLTTARRLGNVDLNLTELRLQCACCELARAPRLLSRLEIVPVAVLLVWLSCVFRALIRVCRALIWFCSWVSAACSVARKRCRLAMMYEFAYALAAFAANSGLVEVTETVAISVVPTSATETAGAEA